MNRREFARLALTGAAGIALTGARRAAIPAPATMLSVAETVRRMQAGATTATAEVEAALGRIASAQPRLNAFISVFADDARREAASLDAEQRAGRLRGPLHGVVLSVKDNIDTAGERTTGGSPVFQMRVPDADSPAIARLRAAGAIVIGKNTLNELAMSDGRQSFYGRVKNPWGLEHETGGSSSGSCAAVAAGLVPAAIGTDTGGSIRNRRRGAGSSG